MAFFCLLRISCVVTTIIPPLWTPPHQPLLIKTGHAPCLGLYLWAGAVTGQATIIPAPDWQRLREVQIG